VQSDVVGVVVVLFTVEVNIQKLLCSMKNRIERKEKVGRGVRPAYTPKWW
jgi:hypothetical protein